MSSVALTTGASKDITKLKAGMNRSEVALVALKEQLATLSQGQIKALQKLADQAGENGASRQVADGRFKTVDGHQAVVGTITVKGQTFKTMLSEGSFDKTRDGQSKYAASLGYRLATRDENRAYAEYLIAKKESGTINEAEMDALENSYRNRYMRDTQGGIVVFGRRIVTSEPISFWGKDSEDGALFVRPSAKSK